jgi:hypothetical protein
MLYYKNLYTALGNLFYAIASADGKISKEEKQQLEELIQYFWKHVESSTDEFATDAANLIWFQFDYNQEEWESPAVAFENFADYFREAGADISPYLRDRIWSSARSIANSRRHINMYEEAMLVALKALLDAPVPVS